MAHLLTADHALAVGLQWAFVGNCAEVRQRLRSAVRGDSADAKQPATEKKPARGGKQAIRYALANGEEGMLLGIEADAQVDARGGAARPARRAPRYAGGLLAAQLLNDAIIFENINPDRVWVCAVRNGLPLPGMDRLTTPEDAAQVVTDVRSYAHAPMTLVGSHPEAGMTLAALLEQVEPDMLRASRMQQPADHGRVAFYAALFVASALAAWFIVSLRPEPQSVAAPIVPQVFGPTDEEIRAGDAGLVAQGLETLLTRPDAAVLTAAWRDVLRGMPYGVGGYRPSQADCQVDACRLQWDWRSEQFERHHIARLPGELLPGKTPGEVMRRAQTRLPVGEVPARRLSGVAHDDLDDWAIALVMRVRRTGARIDVAAPGQPVSVKLPPLRDKKPRAQTIAHEGRVSVIASGWATIQALFDLLGQEQLVVERSVYNITGASISMQMEARYVVLAEGVRYVAIDD